MSGKKAGSLLILIISISILVFIYNYSRQKNILKLAVQNIDTFSGQQAYFLSRDIERVFNNLDLFVKYLEDGNKSFEDSIHSGFCITTRNNNNFDYLCFADRNGNVTNHLGKKQGNVNNLEFFDRIMHGDSKVMDIIYGSFDSSVPKVIFALPLYIKGNLAGSIYGIKNLDALELQFFKYSGDVESIIVDTDSLIIASNRDYAIGSKLDEISPEKIIVKKALDFNGWQLLTIMDKSAAIERYKGKK